MERFCETCEAIASTTKKLEKISMKVLNIGGSTIKEAVCKAGQVAEQEYLDASIRLGDEGDAFFEDPRRYICPVPGNNKIGP